MECGALHSILSIHLCGQTIRHCKNKKRGKNNNSICVNEIEMKQNEKEAIRHTKDPNMIFRGIKFIPNLCAVYRKKKAIVKQLRIF